ncbi:unnamed protein product [Owenia fusiformis]|uniref:Uncharacterized protein n=1 Tax=Owenia fusiformis TaxID=6347 RepID=A0A8J1XM80_OWEFU|nr:unnamed protein product [Owenia fusiformis]
MRKCSSCEVFLLAVFIFLAIGVIVVATLLSLGILGDKNPSEVTISTTDADKEKPGPQDSLASTSPLGEYRYAGVAAPNPECSEIATEMLAKCGSAVDAAIAALLCTAVGSPQNSGIGGGFFMTVYKRETNETTIIDARETAPAAATETMYLNSSLEKPSVWGGLAVGVPGDVAGMWEAHKRFGNLEWKDLFAPAIKMAQDGVKVTPHMYQEAKGYMSDTGSKPLDKFKELRDMLTKSGSDAELLEAGDIQKRPKLANTLQVIADEGASAFYTGSLTDTIVKEIQDFGGIITKDDLKNYVAKVKQPVISTLKNGTKLYGPPPPSSGIVVQFILSLLDGFDLKFESVEEQVESYHKIAEAFKWGYAKRTYFGDTDFENGTLLELMTNMTNPDFIASIRERITEMNMTANASHYSPFSVVADAGTTHISVLAPNGDAVSVTSSINWGYGSLVKGNVTGIIYNNEMDDFSTPGQANAWGFSPSPSNFIVPGKRMQSSMSPTIVTDDAGDVTLVVGAAGGSRIITATSLVALHTLKRNKNIKQAMDARRIHHQLLPPVLNVEDGISDEVKRGLEKRGHVINPITVKDGTFSSGGSAVQGVHRVGHKEVKANSDFRLSGGNTDGF